MSIRETQSGIKHTAIMYTYPGGEVDMILAREGFREAGWEDAENYRACGNPVEKERAKREKGKKSEGEDLARSMRRARANLRRLALANSFDYFVTLTLDKEKVDRYDPKAIMQKVNRIMDNLVRRHGWKYVLVPELHKDGAYHFHGFVAGEVEAVDSGHKDGGGRTIYNLPQWPLGFSTAQRLYGEYSAAVGYCCKYIGKQQGERPMGRWYYSGGGLAKPAKEYLDMDYTETLESFTADAVEFDIPGNRIAVIHTRLQK